MEVAIAVPALVALALAGLLALRALGLDPQLLATMYYALDEARYRAGGGGRGVRRRPSIGTSMCG
jgi:hypothetical protein